MIFKDWINVLAILLSPIIAVSVTLWYQKITDKRAIKKDIFFTLMKNRNSIYMPNDYVQALNSIDFVFNDSNEIKNLWAILYDNYNSKNPDLQKRASTQIDLLSEIAKHLGYANLTQMQINKYYTPQLHADELAKNQLLFDEMIRVLKNSQNFGVNLSQNEQNLD